MQGKERVSEVSRVKKWGSVEVHGKRKVEKKESKQVRQIGVYRKEREDEVRESGKRESLGMHREERKGEENEKEGV